MSSKLAAQSGRIAVVGERELVVGYRLLGVQDAFITGKDDSQKVLMELFNSNKYGLIIVGSAVRAVISAATRDKLESSIIPLVVFMPSFDSQGSEESLSKLARRVLGVDLKVNS
ncbi:MAG TPA: V-type ATP synthase subunit F [Nitrososphaerales archaeon]|nr:V-type ATP synthase subunit F [Nitrososphaerales archaeon]